MNDEAPRRRAAVVIAAAYWMLACLFLIAALRTATMRVQFEDTGTSVVNGLHRYLSWSGARPLRVALVVTVVLVVAAAICSVLAVVATHGFGRFAFGSAWAATACVLASLVALWLIAPPGFNPPKPGPSAPAISVVPPATQFPLPPAPTTVPRP
jgi:hypothetical protein